MGTRRNALVWLTMGIGIGITAASIMRELKKNEEQQSGEEEAHSFESGEDENCITNNDSNVVAYCNLDCEEKNNADEQTENDENEELNEGD